MCCCAASLTQPTVSQWILFSPPANPSKPIQHVFPAATLSNTGAIPESLAKLKYNIQSRVPKHKFKVHETGTQNKGLDTLQRHPSLRAVLNRQCRCSPSQWARLPPCDTLANWHCTCLLSALHIFGSGGGVGSTSSYQLATGSCSCPSPGVFKFTVAALSS